MAAETVAEVRALYARVMAALREEYVNAGISEELLVGAMTPDAGALERVGGVMGEATGEPAMTIHRLF